MRSAKKKSYWRERGELSRISDRNIAEKSCEKQKQVGSQTAANKGHLGIPEARRGKRFPAPTSPPGPPDGSHAQILFLGY